MTAQWRAALTGTPVENRLTELWSIFQFLNPGYLGSQQDFLDRLARPIERSGDAAATQQLKSLVGPFILRRVKTDPAVISDLPEKNEMKVYCSLTKEQATLYQAVVRDSLCEDSRSRGDRSARRDSGDADEVEAGVQSPGAVPGRWQRACRAAAAN